MRYFMTDSGYICQHRDEQQTCVQGDPIVVIDPEDREQVERLAAAMLTIGAIPVIVDHVQAALRSMIAPPKPPEPTWLGAVVEAAHGVRWIRAAGIKRGWHKPMGTWASYDDIDVVKVLSEGVGPMTACSVTVYRDAPDHRNTPRPCGLPVVRHGLCAKHAADKERLSVRRDASDQQAEVRP